MNNLDLLALFQAEEEALTRAFRDHGLIKNNSDEEWLNNSPEILKQVYNLPDEDLCEKLAEHIRSESLASTTLKGTSLLFHDGQEGFDALPAHRRSQIGLDT